MTRISSAFGLLLILTFFSGCNVGNIVKTEKDEFLFNKINELQHQIEQKEWDEVRSNITEFEKQYAQRKWKLQLLAALSDYKDIELEVELLKENVKDEDEVESLIRLRQIHYQLTVIYNM
ncbi:DUF4363 family protein [Halalkalibacter alkalisediminis]|uniref:DUF4363 family protein n=1 Tax=Halalkalibacter alkalisediminis TaxID=935616 RepID=A0ABV6NGA1_9BACI|nr:DUF4363 family protein [Halalkalibacter alkalisediminis]